jgi:glycosyltransferase involved in cell wall biosynthesis
MRILAVTPYYTPEGGGLERYAHETLRRLAARGHDVKALTFTRTGVRDSGRDGVRVERHRPLVSIGNAPIDPGFPRVVRDEIRRRRPDIIVAHTPVPFPAEMAFRAAERAKVPFLVTYHAGRLRGSSMLLDGLARMDSLTLERRMLAGSAGLIAVTPYVRDRALERHRDRVTVVPPGVDATRFTPGHAHAAADILFVGPLSRGYRWKGLDTLWEAYLLVRQERPDATLTLVGDGERRAEFAKRARHSNAPLYLPGRLSEDMLIAAYQRATVAVLPSTTDAESFGMVLAEANACGRPVVGSAVGGIPDFVRHGENGLLTPPRDAAALARSILQLLNDPEHAAAMGARGRSRVLAEHDWQELARRTETVIEDCIARP